MNKITSIAVMTIVAIGASGIAFAYAQEAEERYDFTYSAIIDGDKKDRLVTVTGWTKSFWTTYTGWYDHGKSWNFEHIQDGYITIETMNGKIIYHHDLKRSESWLMTHTIHGEPQYVTFSFHTIPLEDSTFDRKTVSSWFDTEGENEVFDHGSLFTEGDFIAPIVNGTFTVTDQNGNVVASTP